METKYASMTGQEALNYFATTSAGLSITQYEERIKAEGANELKIKPPSLLKIFVQQYANFLMALLIIGSIISIYLKEFTDGFVILGVLLVNGILGAAQEYKAEKLTQALKSNIPQKVQVRRAGQELFIDRKDLVLGDMVLVSAGQILPADLRLIQCFGLTADESALTGESLPVVKQIEELVAPAEGIHAMKNILFAGTIVTAGSGEGVVIAKSDTTEFGHIIAFTQQVRKRSSFLQQINALSDFLFKVTVVIMAFLFVILILFKPDWGINTIFLFIIALAIAIVPEMLPLISTIGLTKAALKLTKQGVLIKRLSSLEDLGAVEMICTDKTGTITENNLKIVKVLSEDKSACLTSAMLASTEVINQEHILSGSFDAAIWSAASAEQKQQVAQHSKIWLGSFDAQFRWQYVVCAKGEAAELFIKGAPETLLDRSTLSREKRQEILQQVTELGENGLRSLVIAKIDLPRQAEYTATDLQNLDYVGLVVFEDPVKPTAAQALQRANALGIQLKILTGDAPEVTMAVARQIGLTLTADEVLTGAQLAKIDIRQRHEAIHKAKIFARVNPKEKYEIVQVLAKQYSVMFLGEGINDAPALKVADVGMVVQEASDLAKEVADIILTKADLSVIVQSIDYGRNIMLNISKYILITLTGNFGSLYAICLLSVITPILPLLPIQILLENILTDVPMIGLINLPMNILDKRKPFHQDIRRIAFNGTLLGIVILLIQFIVYQMFSHLPIELFRTLWLIEMILFEFMLIVSLRTTQWFWKAGQWNAKIILGCLAIMVFTIGLPFLYPFNSWFHLQPYNLFYLLPIGLVIGLGIVILEVTKRWLVVKEN